MQDTLYFKQAQLMLRVLPHVAVEEDFALKGGSAINFFVRDMPRLSVDIDLVWLPLSPRDTALAGIDRALGRIADRIRKAMPDATVQENKPRGMAELLDPRMQDIEPTYRREFEGMVLEPVSLDILMETRSCLIRILRGKLTEADKHFVLAVKRGDADWGQFVFTEAAHMPAVQWKLHNLERMTEKKRCEAAEKLEAVLFG